MGERDGCRCVAVDGHRDRCQVPGRRQKIETECRTIAIGGEAVEQGEVALAHQRRKWVTVAAHFAQGERFAPQCTPRALEGLALRSNDKRRPAVVDDAVLLDDRCDEFAKQRPVNLARRMKQALDDKELLERPRVRGNDFVGARPRHMDEFLLQMLLIDRGNLARHPRRRNQAEQPDDDQNGPQAPFGGLGNCRRSHTGCAIRAMCEKRSGPEPNRYPVLWEPAFSAAGRPAPCVAARLPALRPGSRNSAAPSRADRSRHRSTNRRRRLRKS
jgi:hypothetical protein